MSYFTMIKFDIIIFFNNFFKINKIYKLKEFLIKLSKYILKK